MVCKVVGVQRCDYDFTGSDGRQISYKGYKLHCIDTETKPDGLLGDVVTVVKVSDGSVCASLVSAVKVGQSFQMYFDQKGNLAYFAEVK